MSSSAVLEQFRSSSRDLFLAGVVSSHGGNLSVRKGDRILITRRGSMLARLDERDIIATGLEENDANVMLASTEIGVHRAIYLGTSAQAIVHAPSSAAGAWAHSSLCGSGSTVEPLAPENLLIFAPGPLTGTSAPASGRHRVTSRSPLTGTVINGDSGADWGARSAPRPRLPPRLRDE